MKKGFTLIELLSVIIILAIILVIAVPQVLKTLNSSKMNAHISNNQMVLKSAELFVANNTDYLPSEIGSTVEITIQTLIENNVLKEFKLGNNDCNGYVLITKINETEYDYTPHINCVENILNSSEDGLLLHYKFDDFQEPTRNLLENTNIIRHNTSTLEAIDELYNNEVIFRNSVNNPNTGNNFGIRMNNSVEIDNIKNLTLSFNSRIIESPGILYGYARVRYSDGEIQHHGWNYSPSNWHSNIDGKFNKTTGIANLNVSKTPTELITFFIYRDFALQGIIDFNKIQIEEKPYATPYTKGYRSGVITDYSINNNSSNLTLTTTPRWIDDSIRGGSYLFDGKDQQIVTTLEDQFDQEFTLNAWIKRVNNEAETHQRLIGFRIFGKGIDVDANNNVFAEIQVNGNRVGTQRRSINNVLPLNEWVMLSMTVSRSNSAMIFYKNGKILETRTLPIGEINLADNLVIGNELQRADMQMEKSIDDVRIYNRALSSEEIKLLYNLEK